MVNVYLSRRNLLTLLSKLDRVKAGGESHCRITKFDTVHPKYPCSEVTVVQAVEDEEYYRDRAAGEMTPEDEVKLPKPVTGVAPHGGSIYVVFPN